MNATLKTMTDLPYHGHARKEPLAESTVSGRCLASDLTQGRVVRRKPAHDPSVETQSAELPENTSREWQY